jgi:hypothetical protein
MTKELLTPIVAGLFGAVIAPLVAQVVVPWVRRVLRLDPATAPAKARGRRGVTRGRSTLLAAAVGGVLGGAAGYLAALATAGAPCAPFAPTSVAITSIAPGSGVPRLTTVYGTSCHVPSEHEIWVLVLPEGLTTYYPQPGPVVPTAGGGWSASVYLGSEGSVDVGKAFLVVAALADENGAAALRANVSRPEAAALGIEPLPAGVQMMSEVRVVRR